MLVQKLPVARTGVPGKGGLFGGHVYPLHILAEGFQLCGLQGCKPGLFICLPLGADGSAGLDLIIYALCVSQWALDGWHKFTYFPAIFVLFSWPTLI